MMTPSQLGLLAKRVAREFSDDNCTQMAAAISYYVLFSLFPLLIFAVGVTGFVLQDSDVQRELVELVQENLPVDEGGEDDISESVSGITGAGSGAVGLLGLLGMAWSGSNMFGVIRRSLNQAWDIDRARPIVRQKLLDFMMMLLLGSLFLTSIVATAFLRNARALVEDAALPGGAGAPLGVGWDLLAVLVPITVSAGAFFLLFWLLPATHVPPRQALVGALVAAPLFEVAKVGFTVYLEHFGNYSAVYGGLGAAVIFLFWVFISANILLLSAEVASEYPRVMRGDYDAVDAAAEHPAAPMERLKRFAHRLLYPGE
ncbi:MAG: YihY/virulence factor BrkB family protein [Tepidiformaceae bacterium]